MKKAEGADQRLGRALTQLRELLERTNRAGWYEAEATETEVRLLEALHAKGPMQQRDLARATAYDAPWVSRSSARLTAKGWVSAETVRGRPSLSLTAEGRARLHKVFEARERLWRDVWKQLAPGDRKQAQAVVEAISTAIEAMYEARVTPGLRNAVAQLSEHAKKFVTYKPR